MRKWISLLLCLALISAPAGCGNSGASPAKAGSQPAGVNDVLAAGMAKADGKADTGKETPEPVIEPDTSSKTDDDSVSVDVDLTALSSTMVYSEVYNMVTAPENYIGKTVKMDGLFAHYHDAATNNDYFACIIQDATACCAQGIEFVLTDDYTYPDDYPEIDDFIRVVGVFDTYREGDYTYCTLRNAKLL